MRLLFDLRATQPSLSIKVHGGGKYAIAVFFALAEENVDMDCVYDSRLYLREDIAEKVRKKSIRLTDLAQKSYNEILTEGGYDVFYSALMKRGITVPECTQKITTVHGLRELEMPKDWWFLLYRMPVYETIKTIIIQTFRPWWRRVLLKRSEKRLLEPGLKFITVSEHTKYSCLSYVPQLRADKLKVFYSPSTSTMRTDIKPYTTGYKYVMLVSGNRKEKNALRGLVALDEIFTEHPEFSGYRVMVAGATDRSYRHKFRNAGRFCFLGYVDEDVLESLYCGADIFVYPSLCEGFGYPPLEAMHYGVPVIASSLTSISEVCGAAALYCNPFDYKEIKGRLLRLMTDRDAWQEYRQRSLRRYEEVTARQKDDLKRLVDFIINLGTCLR